LIPITSERLNVGPSDVSVVFPAVSMSGFAGIGVEPHYEAPYYFWCRVDEREPTLAAISATGFPVSWSEQRQNQ
jgi:hypothetical protein